MKPFWLVCLICAGPLSAETPDAVDEYLATQTGLCAQLKENVFSVPFWIHRHSLGGCRVNSVQPLSATYALDVVCEDEGEVLLNETWEMEQLGKTKFTIRDAVGGIFGTLDCSEEQ